MRNLRRWFARNPVDLAYVSMLKHDAYVAVGAGRRLGFPVVLRPEGAGATGDLAWQSWGRFGRTIGRRCRQADAVRRDLPRRSPPSCSAAGYDAGPDPRPAQRRPRPRRRPGSAAPTGAPRRARSFVGRLAPEKGLDTADRRLARASARDIPGPG